MIDRSTRLKLARACRILVAGIGARPLWTDDGPTEAARELRRIAQAGLTPEQSQLLGTAWALWDSPPVARESTIVRTLDFQVDQDDVARAVASLHRQHGLAVSRTGDGFVVTSEDGQDSLAEVQLRVKGVGTQVEVRLAPAPLRAGYAIAGTGLLGFLGLVALASQGLSGVPVMACTAVIATTIGYECAALADCSSKRATRCSSRLPSYRSSYPTTDHIALFRLPIERQAVPQEKGEGRGISTSTRPRAPRYAHFARPPLLGGKPASCGV